jgi:hypothetical protein
VRKEMIVPSEKMLTVGDVIRAPAFRGGFRVWRVIGVFLGGENQEGVIELETLDLIGNTQGRMCVPVELLESSLGGAVVD